MARILILDENLPVREFLSTVLARRGHKVTEAADGASALDAAQSFQPDLIITDILMPKMDGFEFAHRLREKPALARIPVIFFSATYQNPEARALAQQCGVTRFLEKPATPAEVYRAVREALRVPAAVAAPAPPSATFDAAHLRLINSKLAEKVLEVELLNLRLEALVEIGRKMSGERNPERLLLAFCTAARDSVVAKWSVIRVFGDGGHDAQFAGSGIDSDGADALENTPTIREFIGRIEEKRETVSESDDLSLWDAGGVRVRSFLGVPISTSERHIGVLYVCNKLGSNAFSEQDQKIVGLLATQMGVAYENAKHQEQIQDYISKLQLMARRVIDAQELERRRVARELHDSVGQSLTAVKITLQAIQRPSRPSTFKPHLNDALAVLEQLTNEVRNLSLELRPSVLDDLGLAFALRWYTDSFRIRTGLEVQFSSDLPARRVAHETETACFRITQEALNNISKHARASRVSIEVFASQTHLSLIIRDDGIGFDVGRARARALAGSSMGILGMEERVELLGGSIEIASAPDSGTQLTVRFLITHEIARAS